MSYVRTAMVSVRMSPELKAVLAALARKQGLALSLWMQRAARAEARRILGEQEVPLGE